MKMGSLRVEFMRLDQLKSRLIRWRRVTQLQLEIIMPGKVLQLYMLSSICIRLI